MTRLKLEDIAGEKPIKLTIEIPARLHRDLVDYGLMLNGGRGDGAPGPADLVPPMLARFVAGDRAFRKQRQGG